MTEQFLKGIEIPKSSLPKGFECPDNMRGHLAKVFAGEYDIPLDGGPFKIIDLGANCGAFARWALARWPGSTVHAYEPNPETFEYLKKNCEGHSVSKFKCAVFGVFEGTARLRLGKNNCGEASLFKMGMADSGEEVSVAVIPPRELPEANILKLDVEGSELDILYQLICVEQRRFDAIMLEYHSETIRRTLEFVLWNYTPIKADIACPGRGTICYVRADLIGG